MKRWEIRRAYDNICPDSEAKNRMLEKILSAASESTSYGKEKQMKQTNWKRLWLIAAVISVAVFLMGCAVILYTLEDLQIGDTVSVFLRAILPEKHKIKLNILEKLPSPLPVKPEFFITSGHIGRWEYYPGSKAITYF